MIKKEHQYPRLIIKITILEINFKNFNQKGWSIGNKNQTLKILRLNIILEIFQYKIPIITKLSCKDKKMILIKENLILAKSQIANLHDLLAKIVIIK